MPRPLSNISGLSSRRLPGRQWHRWLRVQNTAFGFSWPRCHGFAIVQHVGLGVGETEILAQHCRSARIVPTDELVVCLQRICLHQPRCPARRPAPVVRGVSVDLSEHHGAEHSPDQCRQRPRECRDARCPLFQGVDVGQRRAVELSFERIMVPTQPSSAV